MTEAQVNKLTKMLNEAFNYADKHEIFVVITPDGIEIGGKHAVDLPTTYITVQDQS